MPMSKVLRERGFSEYRYAFRYRCRRCDAIFSGGGSNKKKDVETALRTALQLGPPTIIIHEGCQDGSRPGKGIGDLIGYDDYGPLAEGL